MSHLEALTLRRFNEAARLAKAKTDGERALRSVWLAQIDKEIAYEFYRESGSFKPTIMAENLSDTMTDDELLAALERQ